MSWEKTTLFIFIAAIFGLGGCQPEPEKHIPDVSSITINTEFRRFEQSLFQLDTNQMESSLAHLEEDFPEFSKIFFTYLIPANNPRFSTEERLSYIQGFIQEPAIRRLYDTTQVVFRDPENLWREFEQAFRFFNYYFPEEAVPTVTTFISEYSMAAFVYGDNGLAVGLDLFLGSHYPYQQYNPGNPAFSQYLVRSFNREHLTLKGIQALVNGLAGEPTGGRLLDLMIHNGKKYYIIDHLLPYAADSVKLETTPGQVAWMEDNELEMWAYLLKEELLYSSDYNTIRKLVDYSPHSPGMPPEAPGRTANWLGWQIVRAYMEQRPETTLPELLQLTDAQALLDASRYKPGRK